MDSNEVANLKSLLSDQPQLLLLVNRVEKGEAHVLVVCQSVGFHDDPDIHRRVVEYLQSLGCETHLAPDGKPDRGLVGVKEEPR